MIPSENPDGRPAKSASPDPVPRGVGSLLAGVLAGGAGLAVALGAGYLLYHRLWEGSPPILIVVLAGFGIAGGYAAWLLGVLVFSISRGDREDG